MDVIDAITSRRSVRGFLPTPVPRETVERLLEVAARAPSGSNIQPWRVHVLTGAAKERLSRAMHELRARAATARAGDGTDASLEAVFLSLISAA